MRIRDKLFPEGGKFRLILRKINTFFHKLKIKNIKLTFKIIKKNGFSDGMKELKYILNGTDDNNYLYQLLIKATEPNKEELEVQRNTKFKIEPKISIIVPMYNTPVKFFKELVDSLINQTYSNWELCLADGSPEKNDELKKIHESDSRIKYSFIGENKGISGNTNEALKLASGDFIALLDHDDLLPIFSLYEVVKCINENPDVEFIYTDEDKITTLDKPRFNPHYKPDFSLDFLRSNNYICHFSIFKKELMDKLGGFRSKYDGAQDFDIIIRMSENTKNIVHIPKVLYHWRVHENSTAKPGGEAKPYAFEAGVVVVQDHLERMGIKATVTHGATLGTYRTDYEVEGNPKVSIIIPNKDAIDILDTCIKSILEKTTYSNYEIVIVENNSENKETFEYYKKIEENDRVKIVTYPEKKFNYSAIINYGVKNSDGEFILQLNNDTELLTENWLEQMIGFAQREDVGAVGCKLYYPDNTIQHAGIIIGIESVAGHLFRGLPRHLHGYFARESTVQDFNAVTAACMMAKRSIYEEVDYMDESFEVSFNDLDFCLKIREKGKLIVYTPFVEFYHYESKTRGYEDTPEKQARFAREIDHFKQKWSKYYEKVDRYYNPNFALDSHNYDIKSYRK